MFSFLWVFAHITKEPTEIAFAKLYAWDNFIAEVFRVKLFISVSSMIGFYSVQLIIIFTIYIHDSYDSRFTMTVMQKQQQNCFQLISIGFIWIFIFICVLKIIKDPFKVLGNGTSEIYGFWKLIFGNIYSVISE